MLSTYFVSWLVSYTMDAKMLFSCLAVSGVLHLISIIPLVIHWS